MTAPLVSIVVPCFNAAAWLAATLESALAQTWPHTEVIVVDDGSQDGSPEIAAGFARRGVQVLRQPNRGAAAARNAGLRAARGSHIQFLDADDLLAPDKIARQIGLFAGTRPAGLVAGAWGRFHTDPVETIFTPEANWRDLTGVEFLQLHYETGCMMHPAAWLAPRALLDAAGPWDESLSLNDDGEYFARVMLRAGHITFCAESRSYYRSGLGGSLSGRTDRRSLESLFRSVELTIQHLQAADTSLRTQGAVADAWMQTAWELYPGAPDLSRTAETRARATGPSRRPLPAGPRRKLAALVLGWRLAKRLFR